MWIPSSFLHALFFRQGKRHERVSLASRARAGQARAGGDGAREKREISTVLVKERGGSQRMVKAECADGERRGDKVWPGTFMRVWLLKRVTKWQANDAT